MNIKDYKYDKENFQQQALDALQKKQEADSKLAKIEQAMNGQMPKIDYYKAYLEYMSTDNEHMRTCLDYIKYYYEAMSYYSEQKESSLYMDFAKKAEEYFDKYHAEYTKLKRAENALRISIQNVENKGVDLRDNQQLFLLHMSLMNSDSVHLQVHTKVETWREKEILPFFNRCDLLIPESTSEEGSEPNA